MAEYVFLLILHDPYKHGCIHNGFLKICNKYQYYLNKLRLRYNIPYCSNIVHRSSMQNVLATI